ncbi:hypothetical protein CXG81DRAFT_23538 [Caulochytrium protostelioides]|uniref:WD40 repeat-like protein n=1 Tax=Caulochytrium protostelioides TaxID=1555241 RepID=A0A4P9XE82_9FUNG|nr:hypothetical protein CXG81DRAFT_23538 [Caulochytrium protostelioides]|eukprot:RKP03845.1 hypothetical protein CXG81DRAFT_23538 [Caulochytrium protostelioides]
MPLTPHPPHGLQPPRPGPRAVQRGSPTRALQAQRQAAAASSMAAASNPFSPHASMNGGGAGYDGGPARAAARSGIDPLGLRMQDASLHGPNVRVGGRRSISVYLQNTLRFEAGIACFDVCHAAGTVAVAQSHAIAVLDLASLSITALLKKGMASAKNEIRVLAIDPSGRYVAVCSGDPRITVWDIAQRRVHTAFPAHSHMIHALHFASPHVLWSTGEDGEVHAWDLSGKTPRSVARLVQAGGVHALAVTPVTILTATSDGHATAWSQQTKQSIDRLAAADGPAIAMAPDAYLAAAFSPNRQYAALGTISGRCHVAYVASYMKNETEIMLSQAAEAESLNALDRRINVLDADDVLHEEIILDHAKHPHHAVRTLEIGQVAFGQQYTSTPMFVLRHEGPVTDVVYSAGSDFLVTASSDCTLRIWSAVRGSMMFQISLPSRPTQVRLLGNNQLITTCEDRLLIFNIKTPLVAERPVLNEDGIPQAHLSTAMPAHLMPDGVAAAGFGGQLAGERSELLGDGAMHDDDPAGRLIRAGMAAADEARDGADDPTAPENMTTTELLHAFLMQADVPAAVLNAFIDECPSIRDAADFVAQLRTHDLSTKDVLRLFVHAPYHPRDTLAAIQEALASHRTQDVQFLAAIRARVPITAFMHQKGFRPIELEHFHTLGHLSKRAVDLVRGAYATRYAHHQQQRQHYRTQHRGREWTFADDDLDASSDEDDDNGRLGFALRGQRYQYLNADLEAMQQIDHMPLHAYLPPERHVHNADLFHHDRAIVQPRDNQPYAEFLQVQAVGMRQDHRRAATRFNEHGDAHYWGQRYFARGDGRRTLHEYLLKSRGAGGGGGGTGAPGSRYAPGLRGRALFPATWPSRRRSERGPRRVRGLQISFGHDRRPTLSRTAAAELHGHLIHGLVFAQEQMLHASPWGQVHDIMLTGRRILKTPPHP